MKKFLIRMLTAALAVVGLLSGCKDQQGEDNKVEQRELRVLDGDFKYEITREEYTVVYDNIELFGELYSPKADGKFPAVIFSHGYNGHYTDFPNECKRFAQRGYVCYAFDYCGAQANGRSKGRTGADYTPFTMKEDLRAVIADIKMLPEVDETQIFLFGGSQGGFVTALTAADDEIKEQIAAVALYFPAFNIPDDWRNAPVQDTPLMGYSIGAAFISSIRDLDVYELIGNYEKDVCIVWGDQDALVKKQYIDRAVETYDHAELTVIHGAGHGFGGTALKTATETVLAFLEARTYE